MSDLVSGAIGGRTPETDPLGHDERVVRERLGIVRDLLQGQRARRGGRIPEAHVQLQSAVTFFLENARNDGWMHTFDNLVTVAQKAAADPRGDTAQRAELAKVVAYLQELEVHVVRVGQSKREPSARDARPAATNPVLRASTGGVPALHHLKEFVPPAPSLQKKPAFIEPGALHQLRVLARDVLEELASLALLRTPTRDERWTMGADFEVRLLQMLDAAITLSRGPISLDIVHAARKRAQDFPVADPSRWFVPTFLLACTESERAMDAMREIIIAGPEGAYTGFVDAVCLGSNPERIGMTLSLLDEDDRPDILCLALDVLARLGRPIEGRFLDLVEHPNPNVATRAMTAAAVVSDAPNLVARLQPLLGNADVATHVARILTTLAPEFGAPHLRDIVSRGAKEGASDDHKEQAVRAAETLAALGQTRDTQLLLDLAKVTDAVFPALGTMGTPETLEFLRSEISRRGATTWRADPCVLPLERITGLVEVDDSTPDGRVVAREQWLAKVVAFAVPNGALRVRLGQAFQRVAIVDELRHPDTLVETRRMLIQEARVLGAKSIPVDLEGWIAPQLAWFDLAKQAGWPAPARRA